MTPIDSILPHIWSSQRDYGAKISVMSQNCVKHSEPLICSHSSMHNFNVLNYSEM